MLKIVEKTNLISGEPLQFTPNYPQFDYSSYMMNNFQNSERDFQQREPQMNPMLNNPYFNMGFPPQTSGRGQGPFNQNQKK